MMNSLAAALRLTRPAHTPQRHLQRDTKLSAHPSGSQRGPAELAGCGGEAIVTPHTTYAQAPAGLPPPPNLGGRNPRSIYNATALAFLGDAVWEMYTRRKFFFPPTKMGTYYHSVKENVRAERQAEHYAALTKGGFLTAEERSVLRWGRNATGSTSPKRFSQPDVSREAYRAATAVECLVGYLYLTDLGRLDALMIELGMHPEDSGSFLTGSWSPCSSGSSMDG